MNQNQTQFRVLIINLSTYGMDNSDGHWTEREDVVNLPKIGEEYNASTRIFLKSSCSPSDIQLINNSGLQEFILGQEDYRIVQEPIAGF